MLGKRIIDWSRIHIDAFRNHSLWRVKTHSDQLDILRGRIAHLEGVIDQLFENVIYHQELMLNNLKQVQQKTKLKMLQETVCPSCKSHLKMKNSNVSGCYDGENPPCKACNDRGIIWK